jgi:hypothetical protein
MIREQQELDDLKARWKKLHQELFVLHPKISLAGLFVHYVPPGYFENSRRILYIGKATAGEFLDENAPAKWFNRNSGGFWSFARRMSKCANPDCANLSNLAWSNLFKIGKSRGNPNGKLAAAQKSLAVETLRAEIRCLKPTLVVCVAAGYQDHIFYDVLGIKQNIDDGFVEEFYGKWAFYSRPAYGEWPPILWMSHPQGKTRDYLEAGERIAQKLMEGHI